MPHLLLAPKHETHKALKQKITYKNIKIKEHSRVKS